MKNKHPLHPDAPLLLNDHARPVTRRELISQGFKMGTATVMTSSAFGFFAHASSAQEAEDNWETVQDALANCGINANGGGKIPFICFDLAGGANIAGSNVLIGQKDGQEDFLTAGGYSKQGLPADMSPALNSMANPLINEELGLKFHASSAVLAGILSKVSILNRAQVNGAVIAARSENDTANNPHNPMYYIYKAGAQGDLLDLIGSRNTDSGGNSMSTTSLIEMDVRAKVRPTKVDNPNDARGLVDVGELLDLMNQQDIGNVMEATYRISNAKLGSVTPGTGHVPELGEKSKDTKIKDSIRCAYAKSADLASRFSPAQLDPALDTNIVGGSGILTTEEFLGDGELRKTASVMKLVLNGHAAAGTITMGGYDYHTGDRSTGEVRDERVGRCIGTVLEYAARLNKPVMIYVFSDGSVFSNGMLDNSMAGGGKGVWTGDDQQTAAAFFLVYNPTSRPVLLGSSVAEQMRHQQIGYMRASGDVETSSSPAANNVNLLVETLVLNYMALHGEHGNFSTLFRGHGLGSGTMQDKLRAFQPICNGTINQPV